MSQWVFHFSFRQNKCLIFSPTIYCFSSVVVKTKADIYAHPLILTQMNLILDDGQIDVSKHNTNYGHNCIKRVQIFCQY